MRFTLPQIDDLSFWLGVILSSIFWWIVMALRPIFEQIGETLRARQAESKEKARASSAVEDHYRRKVLTQAQGWHLAAPLFSLDEIILPPLLLAPPPRIEPGSPLYLEDITTSSVPYLPAWPELAGTYYAPTLTLAQALSGNSDIVLTGQPGMGKTVALAHLASCLARRESGLGLPEDTLPFLIHVADLNLPIKRDEPLNPIINILSDQAAVFDVSHIPDMVRGAFEDGRALVLLDGTDELTPEALKEVVEFIKAVKRTYPKSRMVTTSSTDYLDGLVTLNFIPFTLAAWTPAQRMKFLEKWGDLWIRFVATETWAQVTGPSQIDPLLVNNWLITDSLYLTPLEMTLEAWGAYAGDGRGPRPIDALETHIRRLTPANSPREALEMLALQLSLATEPIFDPRQARDWLKSFEPPEPVAAPDDTSGKKGNKSKKQVKQQAPSLGLISKMVDSGLLIQHRNNRMRFAHPVFGGYLAGRALVNYKPESLLDQPPWIGKFLSMQYFAAHGDASSLATALLAKPDRPLSRNLMTIARWLRDSPRQAPWRGRVLSKMVELLKHEGQPLGLRGQPLAAFVQSGDPSVASLLRQLLTEQSGELLQLIALGCGALQDVKAVKDLGGLLTHMSPTVRRAACLALVNIGTAEALDTVGAVLLHGDEDSRKGAAEALANHPGEGHAMLREAALMKDDLMVRRAAAYGLGRIAQPWAEELLTKMQVEDDQWAVRNAAVEIVEYHLHPNPSIPKHLPIPSQSPWLIAYAGKQGLGISPDKTPIDLLLNALKTGTEEERLGALTYLRMMPMEGVFGALYQAMYGGETYLREAAYQTIFEMAARGVEVPDPVQFGFGL